MRLLRATCRIHVDGPGLALWEQRLPIGPPDSGQPVIVAAWHQHIVGACLAVWPYVLRGHALMAIVSQHGDAAIIADVVARTDQRVSVARGSSASPIAPAERKYRGGREAYHQLATALRDGLSVVVTVDGPQGPRHEAKHGALLLARDSGCPILPIAFGASRAAILNRTWDRFRLPLPLDSWVGGPPCRLHVAEPLWLRPDAPDHAIPFAASALNRRLSVAANEAERQQRATAIPPDARADPAHW